MIGLPCGEENITIW